MEIRSLINPYLLHLSEKFKLLYLFLSVKILYMKTVFQAISFTLKMQSLKVSLKDFTLIGFFKISVAQKTQDMYLLKKKKAQDIGEWHDRILFF